MDVAVKRKKCVHRFNFIHISYTYALYGIIYDIYVCIEFYCCTDLRKQPKNSMFIHTYIYTHLIFVQTHLHLFILLSVHMKFEFLCNALTCSIRYKGTIQKSSRDSNYVY